VFEFSELHARHQIPPGVGRSELSTSSKIDLVNDLVHHQNMTEVSVHEAKTHLSRLLRRVEAGEDIAIKRGVKVVARLVPAFPYTHREFGRDRGLFEIPEDFDAPLPADVLDEFE
jgi:prevent-host-death family protein